MRPSFPVMFPIYAVTNLAILILGYESASARLLPHWAVMIAGVSVALLTAFQWSRSLSRACKQEERAYVAFLNLLHEVRR